MSSGLRLDRWAKTFPNGTAALGELSAEIEAGALVFLLGPSGCGKSTVRRASGTPGRRHREPRPYPREPGYRTSAAFNATARDILDVLGEVSTC